MAELGRTPFDIHPAESEVVGGPFVEYSGAHWSVFFLAEYINTFAIAALTVLLFFGGWLFPGLPGDVPIISLGVFLAKTYLVILVIFWIRGTYPRLRIDQLMSLGWKVLVPLAFVNILMTGAYLFYGWPAWVLEPPVRCGAGRHGMGAEQGHADGSHARVHSANLQSNFGGRPCWVT